MAEKPRVAKMVAELLSGGRLWTRRGQCRNLVTSCFLLERTLTFL